MSDLIEMREEVENAIDAFNRDVQRNKAYELSYGLGREKTWAIGFGDRIAYMDGKGGYKLDQPNPDLTAMNLDNSWKPLTLSNAKQEVFRVTNEPISPRFENMHLRCQFIIDDLVDQEKAFGKQSFAVGSSDAMLYSVFSSMRRSLNLDQKAELVADSISDLAIQGIAIEKAIPCAILDKLSDKAREDTQIAESLKSVYPGVYDRDRNEVISEIYEKHKKSLAQNLSPYVDYRDESIAQRDVDKFFEMLDIVNSLVDEGMDRQLAKQSAFEDYVLDEDMINLNPTEIEQADAFSDFKKEVSRVLLENEDDINDELANFIYYETDISDMVREVFVNENTDRFLGGNELVEFPIYFLGEQEYKDDVWLPGSISDYDAQSWKDFSQLLKLINVNGHDLYAQLQADYGIENNDIKAALDFSSDPKKSETKVESVISVIEESSYGGVPVLYGFVEAGELMNLDFSMPIEISGNIQFGIHDNMNGSGFVEDVGPGEIKLPARMNKDKHIDIGVGGGYSINSIFDFHKPSLKINVDNIKEIEVKKENGIGF